MSQPTAYLTLSQLIPLEESAFLLVHAMLCINNVTQYIFSSTNANVNMALSWRFSVSAVSRIILPMPAPSQF